MDELCKRTGAGETGITCETDLKAASFWIPAVITTQNGGLTRLRAANGEADRSQFGVRLLCDHLLLCQCFRRLLGQMLIERRGETCREQLVKELACFTQSAVQRRVVVVLSLGQKLLNLLQLRACIRLDAIRHVRVALCVCPPHPSYHSLESRASPISRETHPHRVVWGFIVHWARQARAIDHLTAPLAYAPRFATFVFRLQETDLAAC